MGVLIMKNQTQKILMPLFIGLIATNFTCNGTFWSRVKGLWRDPYQQQADEYTVTPWGYRQLQREIEQKETKLAALKALKQEPSLGGWQGSGLSPLGRADLDKQGQIVGMEVFSGDELPFGSKSLYVAHDPLTRAKRMEKMRLLHTKESKLTGKSIPSIGKMGESYPISKIQDTPKDRYIYSVTIPGTSENNEAGIAAFKSFWRPATRLDKNAFGEFDYKKLKRDIPEARERYKEMSIPYYIQQGWGY
jgi:hypothetical protein